jgi:hypothetical protein
MCLICVGNVSESRVDCKTQECLLRGEALCLPRMWPQFWSNNHEKSWPRKNSCVPLTLMGHRELIM